MKLLLRNSYTFTGMFFFSLSLILLFEIQHFATSAEIIHAIGPQVFPNVIAVCMAVFSVLLFIHGLRKPVIPLYNEKTILHSIWLVGSITLCIVTYILLLDRIGLIPWMFLFLVAGQYILGERSCRRMLCIALGVTIIMYGIFVIALSIVFPTGILGL